MYVCIYIGARQANMLAHLESVFQEPSPHTAQQQQFEDAEEEEEEEGPAKKK